MIEIVISPTNLTINGHAGYAGPGKDIICSAITVLVFNLIHSIEVLTEDVIEYQADKPGHINLEIKKLSKQGRVLMDSFFIGVNDIASVYPKHVQVINTVAERA